MSGEGRTVNSGASTGYIKCQICGDTFYDLGNHPMTCGKRGCAIEAGRRGWWKMTKKELLGISGR